MSELLRLLRERLSGNEPKYRNVRIFPKILEEQNTFSSEEKAHLTRKGFYWYVYYDFKNPLTGKYVRQTPVKNKLNLRYPEFDERLVKIKRIKTDLIKVLKDGHDPYQEEA